MRGIRGAVTIKENTPKAIREAAKDLLSLIAAENKITSRDIISIIFTVTNDLDAAFPAEAARELGWNLVPLLCATEIPVPGSLEKCIRVLIHAYMSCSQEEVRHIYLGDAVKLRPDLNEKKENKYC